MHIELLATDGKATKRILWVAVTSNGVYSGFCSEDRDEHVSYHFDGNVFHTWFREKPTKTLTLPPLKDLDNRYQLYSIVFTSDLNRLHDTHPYKMEKLDAIVSVDTRAYTRGIGVNLYIIPHNRPDLISEMIRFQPTIREAHLFLKCNPWIALVLYGDIFKE